MGPMPCRSSTGNARASLAPRSAGKIIAKARDTFASDATGGGGPVQGVERGLHRIVRPLRGIMRAQLTNDKEQTQNSTERLLGQTRLGTGILIVEIDAALARAP